VNFRMSLDHPAIKPILFVNLYVYVCICPSF
jgi:hypothetical protein